jgi:hypothetical protein
MAEQERRLEAEVKAWLDQAQAADAAEDAQHGADHRGDETPAWMADKQRRLERIRAAKAQLEAEARAGADRPPCARPVVCCMRFFFRWLKASFAVCMSLHVFIILRMIDAALGISAIFRRSYIIGLVRDMPREPPFHSIFKASTAAAKSSPAQPTDLKAVI